MTEPENNESQFGDFEEIKEPGMEESKQQTDSIEIDLGWFCENYFHSRSYSALTTTCTCL